MEERGRRAGGDGHTTGPAFGAPLFPGRVRWPVSVAAVAVGAAIVAWSTTVPPDVEGHILAHAVATTPFLAAATVLSARARRVGTLRYRPLWTALLIGCVTAIASTAAAYGFVFTDQPALLALNVAMIVAGAPAWTAAGLHLRWLHRGQLGRAVDLVDGLTAVVVLGAPVLLLLGEPIAAAAHTPLLAAYVAMAVGAPALVYLTVVNLLRLPRGERIGLGIAVALGVTLTVSLSLQVIDVAGDGSAVALPVLVASHTAVMVLLMCTPLWGRQHAPPVAAVMTGDRSARFNPMPYVSAVVLPVLALAALVDGNDQPWKVPFVLAVLLAVVGLNAVRYTAMRAEARRLHGGLARMAEERRELLADLLRALEEDRHRTAGELHAQAVRTLTTLGTTIQSAYAALPADTALTVKEAMAQAQHDLAVRAEELRRLMLAVRPPLLPGDGGRPADRALAPALAAFASELRRERPDCAVRIDVDPTLHLDWAAMTIAYRIAQEALVDAARHAGATAVTVRVGEEPPGLVVEVTDDGDGIDPDHRPGAPAGRRSRPAMELLAQLGRGELTVRSGPRGGTVVRCVLGVDGAGRADAAADAASVGAGADPGGADGRGPVDPAGLPVAGARRRHLYAVSPPTADA